MNLAKSNLVLLVLAAVLAVPTALQLSREADAFQDLGRVPLLFDGFTADNTGAILLAQPKKDQPAPDPQNPGQKPPVAYDELFLQRTDKGWVLGQLPGRAPLDQLGAPVSKDRVENDVFAHLRTIRSDRERLVASNASPEQLKQYGLDELQAFVLQAFDRTGRTPVAELLVGRDAGQGQTGTEAVRGVFVRKRDSNDVVLYEFEKFWNRAVQVDQWLDKLLLKLEPEQVTRVAVRNAQSGGAAFEFTRADGKAAWTATTTPPNCGAVRQAEVEGLVQRLRYVMVQEYRQPLARVANKAALGLEPPALEVKFTWRDGEQPRDVVLQVGGKVDGKNDYYLLCSESPFLLTWPTASAVPFERNLTELFDPAAPPAGDGKDGDQPAPAPGGAEKKAGG